VKVIDASVLVKLLLREPGWEKIVEYLRHGTISIDLALKEAINAVWKQRNRSQITDEEASIMIESLRGLIGKVVKMEDESNYLKDAISITFKQNVTIYDALYISLAKKKELILLTSDRRQAEAAEREGVKVIKL